MLYVVYFIHVVISLFLIMVVLLQQGKGADLSVFGGGSTQAAFGARGAATLLHKLTVACFVLFIITTMTIGILQRSGSGSSVMTDVEAAAPAAAPVEEAPAAEIPAVVDEAEPAAEEATEAAPETP